MPTSAIEVEGLGKRYMLGETHARASTLREAIAGTFSRRPPAAPRRELWALRDASFTVPEGQLLGIVGANGAGKSTLLKILARITEPTEGVARTRGRVGALIEVGTAFHGELTGRENIMTNGILLGMTRKDIRLRFDDIVEFAGVEQFVGTPLKRYSTGMALRLAFAVAAHFEPEIVVVDEVLAVGDASFQRRCLAKMTEMGREGRTVLFVSHDLSAIGRLCSRAIWVDAGRLRIDGDPPAVIDRYLRSHAQPGASATPSFDPSAPVRLIRVDVDHARAGASPTHFHGDPLTVRLVVDVVELRSGIDLGCRISQVSGTRVLDEWLLDNPAALGRLDSVGRHTVELRMPPLLPAGEYVLGVGLGTDHEDFFDGEVLVFEVMPTTGDTDAGDRARIVAPPVSWQVRTDAQPG